MGDEHGKDGDCTGYNKGSGGTVSGTNVYWYVTDVDGNTLSVQDPVKQESKPDLTEKDCKEWFLHERTSSGHGKFVGNWTPSSGQSKQFFMVPDFPKPMVYVTAKYKSTTDLSSNSNAVPSCGGNCLAWDSANSKLVMKPCDGSASQKFGKSVRGFLQVDSRCLAADHGLATMKDMKDFAETPCNHYNRTPWFHHGQWSMELQKNGALNCMGSCHKNGEGIDAQINMVGPHGQALNECEDYWLMT